MISNATKVRMYHSPALSPNASIVVDESGKWIVPSKINGWQNRRPYLGHMRGLEPSIAEILMLRHAGYPMEPAK